MKKSLFLLVFLFLNITVFSQTADALLGKWVNKDGEANIQIYKKGANYFGKLVWLKKPNNETGKAKVDLNNPESSLKNRPILGLEILKNFSYTDGTWEGGSIYDPKSGKTYSCVMTLKSNDQLNIRGYLGFSFIGRTDTWSRVK
jgi:uncharacterized protein (DUF2147 family)